jgi:hypothetical protein
MEVERDDAVTFAHNSVQAAASRPHGLLSSAMCHSILHIFLHFRLCASVVSPAWSNLVKPKNESSISIFSFSVHPRHEIKNARQ